MAAHLDDEGYIRLKRIMNDRDREGALEIMNKVLKPPVKEAGRLPARTGPSTREGRRGRSAPQAGTQPIPW